MKSSFYPVAADYSTYGAYMSAYRTNLCVDGGCEFHEAPLAEWEWTLLSPLLAAPVDDDHYEVVLFARLTNGTVVQFDHVHIDSWKHDDGMLTFEANQGDQIHYVPNVVSWYTEA